MRHSSYYLIEAIIYKSWLRVNVRKDYTGCIAMMAGLGSCIATVVIIGQHSCSCMCKIKTVHSLDYKIREPANTKANTTNKYAIFLKLCFFCRTHL